MLNAKVGIDKNVLIVAVVSYYKEVNVKEYKLSAVEAVSTVQTQLTAQNVIMDLPLPLIRCAENV